MPNPVTTPPAIKTAEAVLAGRIPLAMSLGITVAYNPQSDEHINRHLDLMFAPEVSLEDYARTRWSLVVDLERTFSEEQAAESGDLETCARIYERAAHEALQTLVGFVEGASQHPTHRLLSRLCMACRDELSALVAEWAALTSPTVTPCQSVPADTIEAAKAALKGEVPADIPNPCAETIARFADLADTPAPVLTLEELEQILPLEQAFHEVLDEMEGSSYRVTPFDNPIYRHELGQARRRTLQRLLELAEASPAPRVEVTTLAGAIAELEKKARDFNKLSRAETTARLEEGMALCAEIKACCRDAITTGDFRLCQAAFAALSMFVNGPPAWERGYPVEVTRD